MKRVCLAGLIVAVALGVQVGCGGGKPKPAQLPSGTYEPPKQGPQPVGIPGASDVKKGESNIPGKKK
jgi:hypothetical protein